MDKLTETRTYNINTLSGPHPTLALQISVTVQHSFLHYCNKISRYINLEFGMGEADQSFS